ncbi:MAG: hypothetical protein C6P35_07370 [Cohnella sp.]|nr:MAG: hypothetical protein C6P35_07370 [Cohnella sp.]
MVTGMAILRNRNSHRSSKTAKLVLYLSLLFLNYRTASFLPTSKTAMRMPRSKDSASKEPRLTELHLHRLQGLSYPMAKAKRKQIPPVPCLSNQLANPAFYRLHN